MLCARPLPPGREVSRRKRGDGGSFGDVVETVGDIVGKSLLPSAQRQTRFQIHRVCLKIRRDMADIGDHRATFPLISPTTISKAASGAGRNW